MAASQWRCVAVALACAMLATATATSQACEGEACDLCNCTASGPSGFNVTCEGTLASFPCTFTLNASANATVLAIVSRAYADPAIPALALCLCPCSLPVPLLSACALAVYLCPCCLCCLSVPLTSVWVCCPAQDIAAAGFQLDSDSFASASLATLRSLRIGQGLSTLPDAVFSPLPALEDLNLAGNLLTLVAPGTFQNAASLRSIDLSNNQITVLPSGTSLGGCLDALACPRPVLTLLSVAARASRLHGPQPVRCIEGQR
jgi:hypothetical protein